MNEWGARLTAARMSRGLSPEQLAAGLNMPVELMVSWEQGQAIPDEALRGLLSQALQVDLVTLPQTNAPKPSLPTPQTTEPKPPEKKPTHWVAVIAAVVAVGAAAAMLILQPWKQPSVTTGTPSVTMDQGARVTEAPAVAVNESGATHAPVAMTELPAPAADAQSMSFDWFRQEDVLDAGAPFIRITCGSNPLKAVHATDFKSGAGWLWIFYLQEINGRSFHADSFTQVVFRTPESAVISEFSADNMAAWWGGASDIAGNDTQSVTGGLEYQEAVGVGCVITGHDDNGKQLSFRGFFALDNSF